MVVEQVAFYSSITLTVLGQKSRKHADIILERSLTV